MLLPAMLETNLKVSRHEMVKRRKKSGKMVKLLEEQSDNPNVFSKTDLELFIGIVIIIGSHLRCWGVMYLIQPTRTKVLRKK